MKKVLLALSAIALASCAQTELDSYSPSGEGVQKISVEVSTSQSEAQTRVAISENGEDGSLAFTWADDDALGGWSPSATSFSAFSMDAGSLSEDKELATFTGNISDADDTYRLIHPYVSNAVISSGSYLLDLSSQTMDMGADEYKSLGESIYMISPVMSTTSTTAPYMQHVGAVIQLNLRFENLPEDAYLSSVKVEGDAIYSSATLDLSSSVTSDSFISSESVGAIKVSASSSPALSAYTTSGETYAVKVNVLPFTLTSGSSLTVTVTVKSGSENYIKSFEVENSGEAIDVARATYLTLNKEVDLMLSTLSTTIESTRGDSISTTVSYSTNLEEIAFSSNKEWCVVEDQGDGTALITAAKNSSTTVARTAIITVVATSDAVVTQSYITVEQGAYRPYAAPGVYIPEYNGVVVSVKDDYSECLIMAVDVPYYEDYPEYYVLKWASATIETGAQDEDDGRVNMATIKALETFSEDTFESDYPAFYWCDTLDSDGDGEADGWYFAASEELTTIFLYTDEINATLLEYGFQTLTSDQWHWCSTEDSSTTTKAYCVRESGRNSYSKTGGTLNPNASGRLIRAVRYVTPPNDYIPEEYWTASPQSVAAPGVYMPEYNGVIVQVDKDYNECLIMAVDVPVYEEYPEYYVLQWSSLSDETGAQDENDGRVNMATIKALDSYSESNYPAFYWCDNLDSDGDGEADGWHLPAYDELFYVFTYTDEINTTLFKYGFQTLSSDQWHWSSTEDSSTTTKARCVRESGGNTYLKEGGTVNPNALGRFIRAVRYVNVPDNYIPKE